MEIVLRACSKNEEAMIKKKTTKHHKDLQGTLSSQNITENEQNRRTHTS